WCYVGRRQLQRAQRLWQDKYPGNTDSFTVQYHPYQLNPDAPRGPGHSKDKQTMYREKFGAERTAMMQSRLTGVGEQLGINFKYGGKTGNTRDSHRLVNLSKQFGNDVELKTVDGLFAAYFENEQDITDHATLKAVAESAGIPGADFQRAIVDSDEGGSEVDRAALEARMGGVQGVPDYVIQDKFRINGGQDASVFVEAFERVKKLEG
ncbi:DsbA family oxidoreductase, partial [Klebsiella pneumoniae]|uniref:DsbA family oxidoreductase n=1 Tax=Klebsiella pneumoniae TaxID=573 RepID=UPI00124B8D6B